MKTKFEINRTHPGPFITVTREYGLDVGIVECRIYRSHLIYSERYKGGVEAGKANDKELLSYAKQLLMSALEQNN